MQAEIINCLDCSNYSPVVERDTVTIVSLVGMNKKKATPVTQACTQGTQAFRDCNNCTSIHLYTI